MGDVWWLRYRKMQNTQLQIFEGGERLRNTRKARKRGANGWKDWRMAVLKGGRVWNRFFVGNFVGSFVDKVPDEVRDKVEMRL